MITKDDILPLYIEYAEDYLKKHLDSVVPSSSNSFKKHLNKLVMQYIEQHATRTTENALRFSDIKYNDSVEISDILTIQGLDNILSNTANMAERLSDKYIQHKQLFKQAFHKEGPDGFKPLETKTTEELSDGMDLIIYRNKVKKYANSFLRSYKDLMNEDTFRLFGRIYDGDYDRSYVQKQIRKIASFKNSEDLNNALTKIIESEHSVDYIKHQIEENNLNADIIYSDDKHIYVDIKDFKASQILGSSQWCISTQEHMFRDYIYGASLALYQPEAEENLFNAEKGNQIFCFNFEVDASDPEFAVGITISNNGTLYAAHNNDDEDILEDIFDEEYEVSPEIFNYIKTIKKHDPDKIINEITQLNEYDGFSIFHDDYLLPLNYRNPLNIMIQFEDDFHRNNEFYSFSRRTQNPVFDFTIIRKSLDDLKQYGDISKNEMFNDLIKSYPILKEINSIKDKKSNKILLDELSRNTRIDNHKFWECVEINQFLKDLNSLDIDINYRKNKQIVHDIFYDFDAHNTQQETKGGVDMLPLSEPGHFVKRLDNEMVKKMLPFVIHDENIKDTTKARLTFLCMKDDNHKENSVIFEHYKKCLKDETIHINKALYSEHWNCMNNEQKHDVVDLMNQKPDIIKDINPKDMKTILTDEVFSKLSGEALKAIKNEYKNNPMQEVSFKDCINIIASKENSINGELFPVKNNKQKKLKA